MFLYKTLFISMQISLEFPPKSSSDGVSAMVQAMACCWRCSAPLPDWMLAQIYDAIWSHEASMCQHDLSTNFIGSTSGEILILLQSWAEVVLVMNHNHGWIWKYLQHTLQIIVSFDFRVMWSLWWTLNSNVYTLHPPTYILLSDIKNSTIVKQKVVIRPILVWYNGNKQRFDIMVASHIFVTFRMFRF